jgi:hypothetical protein
MVSEKRWIGIMAALLPLSLLLMYGCGQKSAEEKTTEKAFKLATGKDLNVNREGGKIRISDNDSKTEIAETSTWPSDLSRDVPQFTAGKIQRVVKSQEQGNGWSFNIYLAGISGDNIKSYQNALKQYGWQSDLMQIGEKGGSLNGQKGTMGINLVFNLEQKDGMLAVYNRP